MINFTGMTHEQMADALCNDIAKNPIHDGSLREAILVALEVVRGRSAKGSIGSDQETRRHALALYLQESGQGPIHARQWARVREIEAYLWSGHTPAAVEFKTNGDTSTFTFTPKQP